MVLSVILREDRRRLLMVRKGLETRETDFKVSTSPFNILKMRSQISSGRSSAPAAIVTHNF
ncbi:hypothetical protein TSUD_260960 [Trifolium subterraneum]|uniref:Uncharacterized protein n=1 Tax=Trifolium subterraneum TaxID=3900 RepID=A0A2Z6LU26_TRISU|nr:hypothetical protein TSUD_260960 [Trifolium subterraneum]